MKYWFYFIFSTTLVTTAFAAKPAKSSEKEEAATVVSEEQQDAVAQAKIFLKRGYHLDQAIKSISSIKSFDLLISENILPEVFNLLDSPTLNKNDRLTMLNFLFLKANLKDENGQKIIKDLLKRVKDIRSPLLSEKMLSEFYKIKAKAPESIGNDILELQNDILEDISLPIAKRIFNHPDYIVTLKNLMKSSDSKSKRLLLKIFQELANKDIAQMVRIEILKTMAAVTLTSVGAEPYFGKSENRDIFLTLNTLLKNAKSAFLKPETLLPEDIEEFKQLLLLTENILSNPENDRDRDNAIEYLVSLLKSHEPEISKLAGECLVNTKLIELEYRLNGLDLGPIFKKNAETRESELENIGKMLAETEKTINDQVALGQSVDKTMLNELKKAYKQAQALNYTSLDLLARYGVVLIRASTKEPQTQLVPVFTQLKDQFNSQKDLKAKTICLKAFGNLDLDLVKSRYFPSQALAILDEMFDKCFAVLDIPIQNDQMDKLKLDIAEVLSETTGMSFGIYSQEWKNWKNGPLGQRFFQRLK